MKVTFLNNNSTETKLAAKLCKDAAGAVFDYFKMSSVEFSVSFLNIAEMQAMNKQFRGKDKPTNVLSFPDLEIGYLGDIAICLDVAKKESSEQNKKLEDHITHLFVHSLLHLMDYDHENDDEAEIMENKEIIILKSLNITNPYVLKD